VVVAITEGLCPAAHSLSHQEGAVRGDSHEPSTQNADANSITSLPPCCGAFGPSGCCGMQ